MNFKKWEVLPLNKERAAELAQKLNIPFFLAMMLNIRGLDRSTDLEAFLGAGEPLSDPFLMKDMDKAVARIDRAIENMERIAVYGDYDADGITSTSILYSYLETRGADVLFYIPQREGEGYGMNVGAVEHLAAQGVSLIITVDNGIASVKEVQRARELGVDVVITDHHRPQEILPDAVAVIDAYQPDDHSPYKDFSGAGVAFKLLMALEDGACDVEDLLETYSDLAALGTIGDVVPLTGENRTLVRYGLERLSAGERPGVAALLEQADYAGKNLSATNVAFTLVPRINATGRMGRPERAVRLLISNYEDEVQPLLDEICADNDARKQVEAAIADSAIRQIEEQRLLDDRVIVVDGENWHHGVIGIVASRIVERYGKPCLVLSRSGEITKGSGRSIEGFSLFEAICACADTLVKFGGHPMAAGITLMTANIEAFRRAINAYAAKAYPQMPVQTLRLDCKLNPAALSVSMVDSLAMLEPFGNENPQPMFGLYNMELYEITAVGGGGHLRLSLEKNGMVLTAMRFGMRPEEFPFEKGDRVDLAVQLDAREYRGQRSLSIIVRDMKPAGFDTEKNHASLGLFSNWQRGEVLSSSEKQQLYPTREHLAAVYRALRSLNGKPVDLLRFSAGLGEAGALGTLQVALQVFEERKLVHSTIEGNTLHATLLETSGKTDISRSPILQALQTT